MASSSDKSIPNEVLTDDARTSNNFFESDSILSHWLQKQIHPQARKFLQPRMDRLGKQAAHQMDELSQKADQHPPELKKRTPTGEKADEIEFHPSYWQLMEMAATSDMFHLKYDPELKQKFTGQRHQMGFLLGQMYAMSELGQYCPLCMTDGAAYVLEKHADDQLQERLLPKLSANTGDELYTGAMYLTEKAGGSDVGRNQTTAEQVEGRIYEVTGEKWFCSNANADVILALARTNPDKSGTRGLSIFVVEKELEDGRPNPMEIVRLKDKLGVRSMATAEVLFKETRGIRLGEEGEGFKIMADMINMSRLYNALTAVAGVRRAVIEAWQYLNHRIIFDKRATEHALIREKFHEVGALHVANFYLVWRTIQALDRSEVGDKGEAQRLRILTPMAKWWSAEIAVYVVRECMELMGGNGYIEDFIMPKLFRDVNVLPIWEGSGNVIVLDILRAMKKSDGLELLIKDVKESANAGHTASPVIAKELEAILPVLRELTGHERDTIEATAKPLFKRFIHLYQIHLMIEYQDATSAKWMEPALRFMAESLNDKAEIKTPPSLEEVESLIAWDY